LAPSGHALSLSHAVVHMGVNPAASKQIPDAQSAALVQGSAVAPSPCGAASTWGPASSTVGALPPQPITTIRISEAPRAEERRRSLVA